MSNSRNLASLLRADGSVEPTKYTDEIGGVADFVASGALPDGSTVILNNDGTVTKTGNITSALAIPYGTESIAGNGNAFQETVPVPNSETKIVMIHRDVNNYGSIVVGTVSGTTITFATPQIFSSMRTDYSKVRIDPANPNQILIHYSETYNGQPTYIKAGTLSGNTISFGSALLISTTANSGAYTSIEFDTQNTGKFILTRVGAATYFSEGMVGTISNNVITLGTAVVLKSGQDGPGKLVMDPFNARFVYLIKVSSGATGAAIPCTFSGTTITVGTETQFTSTGPSVHTHTGSSFDPVQANKLLIVYVVGNTSKHIVGTLSGTTISFGTEATHANVAEYYQRMVAGTASAGLLYSTYQSGSSRYVRTFSISGTTATLGNPIN